MKNRLEILDRLIDIEDEIQDKQLQELEERVTSKIKEEFGEDGVSVAKVYYKQEDSDSQIDDCPECAEKAKKLIQQLQTSSSIAESVTSLDFLKIYSRFDDDTKKQLSKTIDTIEDTFVDILKKNELVYNDDLLRNLLIALVMERSLEKKEKKHD